MLPPVVSRTAVPALRVTGMPLAMLKGAADSRVPLLKMNPPRFWKGALAILPILSVPATRLIS